VLITLPNALLNEFKQSRYEKKVNLNKKRYEIRKQKLRKIEYCSQYIDGFRYDKDKRREIFTMPNHQRKFLEPIIVNFLKKENILFCT